MLSPRLEFSMGHPAHFSSCDIIPLLGEETEAQ